MLVPFFPRFLLLTCAGEQDTGRHVLCPEPVLTVRVSPHKICTTGNLYEELSLSRMAVCSYVRCFGMRSQRYKCTRKTLHLQVSGPGSQKYMQITDGIFIF